MKNLEIFSQNTILLYEYKYRQPSVT
jgi:hypothetical protein